MNELKELESGIDRIKRESQTKRMIISALEKEKAELLKRSEELSERIAKTNEAYKDSSRKVMEHVNAQASQLRAEITELANGLKSLSGLEGRLEEQEAKHEKALDRLEKDMLLVEKSLSDVERMKTELSRQRTFFQEAKLQLEKGMQSGISYIRKEMDVNRKEDAKKALEEFREELERITSLEKELSASKRAHSSRIDSLTEELSSLKSSVSEVRLLGERSKALEEVAKGLERKVSDISNRQRTAATLIAADMSKKMEKGMAGLMKDLEAQRTEDASNRMRELRHELERVAGLEQAMKQSEKRLDGLGRELSNLEPVQEQVALLRDKVEESQHMSRSLAERTVTTHDFERAMKAAYKKTEELDSRLFSVDKRLSTDRARLEKEILGILNEENVLERTQDNVKQFFESRFHDFDKRLNSGLDALTTQMEEGQTLVDRLRQRSQKLDLMTKEIPGKVEQNSKSILSLMDARADLSAALESLVGDAKGFSQGLATATQRVAGLEKGLSSLQLSVDSGLSSTGKEISSYKQGLAELSTRLSCAFERMGTIEKGLSGFQKSSKVDMGRFSSELAAFQQELKSQSLLLKEFSESGRVDMANLRAEMSSALKGMAKEIESRVSQANEAGLKELRERTKNLASMKDLGSELKVMKSQVSGLDSRGKEFAGKMSTELASLKKAMESRLSELSDEQQSRFEKDIGFITKNIDSIRELASDIKIFKDKVSGVERLARSKLSEQDFRGFREFVESRLSGMEEAATESAKGISAELKGFMGTVQTGKVSQDEFSKSMELMETRMKDLGVMIKTTSDEVARDLASFKKLTAERLDSIKGSQLKEFRDELKRISVLEQNSTSTASVHEKRLDSLSEGLSALQSVPSDIASIREKLASLEELSGSMIKARDFSAKLREVSSAVGQLRDGLTSLDKRMHSHSASMDAAIEEALGEERLLKRSQEAMSKLMGSRMVEIEKKLSSRIEELAKGLLEKSGIVAHLRERTSELSRFSEQASQNDEAIAKLKDRLSEIEAASKETGMKASEIGSIMKRLAKIESLSSTVLESKDALKEMGEEHTELRLLASTVPATLAKLSGQVSAAQERIAELSRFSAQVSKNDEDIGKLKERMLLLEGDYKETSGKASEIGSITERIASLEKGLAVSGKGSDSRMDGFSKSVGSMEARLNEKLSEIDRLTKELSQKSVSESEFVETVRAVSKRIDDLEKLSVGVDKKASVHDSLIRSAVDKALSGDSLIKATQKHMEELVDSKLSSLESRLTSGEAEQSSRSDALQSDVESLRKELSKLGAIEKRIDSDITTRMSESLGSFTHTRETLERRIDGLTAELKAMNDKVIEGKGAIAAIEQRMKSGMDKQQATIREMFGKQRNALDSEISDETAKALKEAELGELKRKQEFENLLRKFQELHIKTQQNLDAIAGQRQSFLQLERELRTRMDKAATTSQSRMESEQERFKKRLSDSENLIMKLNNMISELQVRLDKKGDINVDIDGAVSALREDIMERLKTNEDMFDSEMDAFRRRLDNIAGTNVTGTELDKLKKDIDVVSSRLGEDFDRLKRMISDSNGISFHAQKR